MEKFYVAPLVTVVSTGVEVGFCGSTGSANLSFDSSSNFTGSYEVED